MAQDAVSDPFDSLLSLEEQYYTEGYSLGVADGSRAGRIEGRIFGLEKGFDKFLELGRLGGRVTVWNSRLPLPTQLSSTTDAISEARENALKVPPLNGNERLRKHIKRLCDLTDPEVISTENSEDAVAEFDDRLKDAKAKATLISKIVGEDSSASEESSPRKGAGSGVQIKEAGKVGATGEMEDFMGLPGAKSKTNSDR